MFDEIEIPRYGPVQCKLNGSSGLEWKYVTPTMHTDDSLSSTASSGIFEMKVLRGCSSTRWNRAAGGSLTAEVVRPPRALHFDQMPTTVIYRGAVDGSKIIGDVYIVRPLSQIAGGVSAGNTSSSSNTTSVLPLPANAVVGVEVKVGVFELGKIS